MFYEHLPRLLQQTGFAVGHPGKGCGESNEMNNPNWRNYPSGHVGPEVAMDFPSQSKFHANSNIGRRDSVANDRAEYYVAGCVGQVQMSDGDAFDWMSNLRKNPPPAGFVDRDSAYCAGNEKGHCENTTEQRCIEQRSDNAIWTAPKGCLPGRRLETREPEFRQPEVRGRDRGSDGNEAFFSEEVRDFVKGRRRVWEAPSSFGHTSQRLGLGGWGVRWETEKTTTKPSLDTATIRETTMRSRGLVV